VRNFSAELLVQTRPGRWVLRLEARYGREKELGADALDVGGAALHAGYRVGAGALLAGDIGYSRSRFASASGYSRTFASLALRFFY
jgi:hypothetical protein